MDTYEMHNIIFQAMTNHLKPCQPTPSDPKFERHKTIHITSKSQTCRWRSSVFEMLSRTLRFWILTDSWTMKISKEQNLDLESAYGYMWNSLLSKCFDTLCAESAERGIGCAVDIQESIHTTPCESILSHSNSHQTIRTHPRARQVPPVSNNKESRMIATTDV